MGDSIFIRFFCATLAVMLASPVWSQPVPEGLIFQELDRTQTKPDSTAQVVIDAPIDYVFAFLTPRLHEYVEGASALGFDHSGAARPDKLSTGTLRIATMNSGDFLVQRFLVIDKPKEFAYYTDMDRSTLEAPLKYSVSRYRLTELNDGRTMLNVAVTYRATSRLFAFIVRRAFSSALKRDFERAAGIIGSAYIAEKTS